MARKNGEMFEAVYHATLALTAPHHNIFPLQTLQAPLRDCLAVRGERDSGHLLTPEASIKNEWLSVHAEIILNGYIPIEPCFKRGDN
jgi:hypothetical protein